MFANSQGGGLDMGFPDVCLTPIPPVVAPVPYPNIATGSTATGGVYTVLISGMPAHNMGTQAPITNGDNAGGLPNLAGQPGDYIELRAEMHVILALVNAPHVLDDRNVYTATPIRITAWRASITPADDPVRSGTPETLRAFQNTEDYFAV